MRSGEVCQLRCDDISTLHGDLQCIRVHDLYGLEEQGEASGTYRFTPRASGLSMRPKKPQPDMAESWLFPCNPKTEAKAGSTDWFHHYASLFAGEGRD